MAPTVVTMSSGESTTPHSTERRAICRRSAGRPGGGSYETPAPPALRAIALRIRFSLSVGRSSGLGHAAPNGTMCGSRHAR